MCLCSLFCFCIFMRVDTCNSIFLHFCGFSALSMADTKQLLPHLFRKDSILTSLAFLPLVYMYEPVHSLLSFCFWELWRIPRHTSVFIFYLTVEMCCEETSHKINFGCILFCFWLICD